MKEIVDNFHFEGKSIINCYKRMHKGGTNFKMWHSEHTWRNRWTTISTAGRL